MMNKMPCSPSHLAKFLFLLPLVAVLLVAFRNVENPVGLKGNLPLALGNENGINTTGQDNPSRQNDKRNLVNHKFLGNNKILAEFQDGTQETYDISTEAGKQGFMAAQKFMGDAYNPEDITRGWSEEFGNLLKRNPQIATMKWRYDMEALQKEDFVFAADRLFITLKSGAEEVYPIETKADLAQLERKFGKLPLLPPPPPTISFQHK